MAHTEEIEELHQELLRLYPDPVDVLENELALRIGLHRHPRTSDSEWRRARVRAINALDEAELESEGPDGSRHPQVHSLTE